MSYTVSLINIDNIFKLITKPINIIILITLISRIIPLKTLYPWIGIVGIFYTIHFINKIYKRRGQWDRLSENDIVLITGGSKGLGKNLIDLFLKKQIKVINIDKEPLDNEDSKIYHYQCDLNDQNQLKSIIDIIKEKHGYPSIIINNAAIRHSNNLLELSSTEISSLLTINLISPISIYKSFIQFNSKRQYIITIASVLGFISPANLSIYSSTKAALISLHDSLTHELSSNGQIRTLLVVSGQLNTSLFKDINPPKQFIAPVIDSKKLADLIVEKIENGERGILYLPLFTLIVPLLKSLPNFLTEFIRWFSEMDTSV